MSKAETSSIELHPDQKNSVTADIKEQACANGPKQAGKVAAFSKSLFDSLLWHVSQEAHGKDSEHDSPPHHADEVMDRYAELGE